MRIDILTLFPQFYNGILSSSILGRAAQFGKVVYYLHNLRDYTDPPHHKADDYLYGGGAGMLMSAEPLFRALTDLTKELPARPLILFPSPHGKLFQQSDAEQLSRENHLIFICGHYKGVDQRVIERWVDKEYSIGEYVVTGGEIAGAVIIDATVRLIPGVLGDLDSARTDSFSREGYDSPHYTRPEVINGNRVPGVLLSGNDRNIQQWKAIASEVIRQKNKPEPTDSQRFNK